VKKQIVAVLLVLASLFAVAPKASAADSWNLSQGSYDPNSDGSSMYAWVQGYIYNWGCGLRDCASTSNMYGSLAWKSGTKPQRVQMRMVTGYSGTALSVGVSTAGTGSASFSDWGSSCGQGWVQNGLNVTAISLTANGEICKADTLAWISTAWVKTESQYRLGSINWYSANAYKSASLGGL
jgi:hypothetical protein